MLIAHKNGILLSYTVFNPSDQMEITMWAFIKALAVTKEDSTLDEYVIAGGFIIGCMF